MDEKHIPFDQPPTSDEAFSSGAPLLSRDEFKKIVTEYMAAIKTRGPIYDFKIEVDPNDPTQMYITWPVRYISVNIVLNTPKEEPKVDFSNHLRF